MRPTLHEAIRDARGDLSQTEFGRLIGLHQVTLARLENNRHKPATSTLLKLAAYADGTGRADLGTLFHDAAQTDLGNAEIRTDSLLLTDANEIRIVKALLILMRDPKQRERVEDLEAYFYSELREVDRPDHERRRGQRLANRIVAGIRKGKGDKAIADAAGVSAQIVLGYRMAMEGK